MLNIIIFIYFWFILCYKNSHLIILKAKNRDWSIYTTFYFILC